MGRVVRGPIRLRPPGRTADLSVLTATNLDSTPPKLSARLEVTECRFGPIPESEFAEEPFLARLRAGEIIRMQVEEPSTGRSSTGTGWRSSAAGSAWPVGPAWPWEAATATDYDLQIGLHKECRNEECRNGEE